MELLLWLNPARTNAAGTLPLSLRVTVAGERAEYSTKIRLTAKEWDQTRQRLRGDSAATRLHNNSLKTLLARATVNKDTLQAAGAFTARMVADSLRPAKPAKAARVVLAAEILEAARVAHYSTGNANTYENMAAGLQRWQRWRAALGGDVPLSAIDVPMAKQFAGHLARLAPTTRTVYLAQLHTLYGLACPRAENPFAKLGDGRAPELAGPRIPLTAGQLDALKKLPLCPHSVAGRARAVFLTSYYLHGIRLLNVLMLRAADFSAGRVAVVAIKRGAAKNLRVPPALGPWLAPYYEGRPATAPLLPLLPLDYFDLSPAEALRAKKREATRVNDALNRLAKRIGVGRLHAHLARHTLAYDAWLTTKDMRVPQSLLGHRHLSQTEIYVMSMDQAQQDAAGELIYQE